MGVRFSWIIYGLIGLVVVAWAWDAVTPNRAYRQVGVGRSRVAAKMDLTDKLNPAILPDLLRDILQEVAPNQKPQSDEFQKQVVMRLSQRIMDDPDVNYRVDLNTDNNLDPVLVVPESVNGEAAIYSIRVPDPEKYPTDPTTQVDWGKVAEDGVELCALSATFDETTRSMSVDAQPNQYLYENSAPHYRTTYVVRDHSWLQTYFTYMIFRDILFRPYGWYGPGWYGGWYGGYYGRWHAPVMSRPVVGRSTRYRSAPRATSAMTTRSGSAVRSSAASRRTTPPSFIRSRRSTTPARSTTRSSSRSTSRGGGFGFGK